MLCLVSSWELCVELMRRDRIWSLSKWKDVIFCFPGSPVFLFFLSVGLFVLDTLEGLP